MQSSSTSTVNKGATGVAEMPTNVVKTQRDERLWKKAKVAARKKFSEGSDRFYAYTRGIYQQMKGEKAMKPVLLKSRVKAHTRRTKFKVVNVRAHTDSRVKSPKAERLKRHDSKITNKALQEFQRLIQSDMPVTKFADIIERAYGAHNEPQTLEAIRHLRAMPEGTWVNRHIHGKEGGNPRYAGFEFGKQRTKGIKEWRYGAGYKRNYVTTDLDLKGRGVTLSGEGSDHARGLKTYYLTETAFQRVQKRHGKFVYAKSKESEPMKNIDLTKYPALAKAVQRGNLSKSLEFVKTGQEVYLGVMAKIGELQGELLMAIAKWKAGLEPTTSVSDSECVETAEVNKPAKEPWEIRTCRRKIETLQRIARNIDRKKKFKLSEYDLNEYGL